MSAPAFPLTPGPLLHTPIETKATCIHHWLVASLPVAGLYPARCRRCGAQRAFPYLDSAAEPDDFWRTFGDPALSPALPLPSDPRRCRRRLAPFPLAIRPAILQQQPAAQDPRR